MLLANLFATNKCVGEQIEETILKTRVVFYARNTVDLLQSVRELKSYNVHVDFLNNG